MDLDSLSISSISADKQANIVAQAQVAVAQKANQQPKIAGEIIAAAAQSTPEPGKGALVNKIA